MSGTRDGVRCLVPSCRSNSQFLSATLNLASFAYTMKASHLICLCSLIFATGCASTSQSKKLLKASRALSVETQYHLNHVQGLNPTQIKAEEEARWKVVEPAVRSYESGFLASFKTICTRASEDKNVAPLYDYADTLRTQERELHTLGEQNGLNLIGEVRLPTGAVMPIPDYVQHVAREAASVIKSDTDHELQNEETGHFFSSVGYFLGRISAAALR